MLLSAPRTWLWPALICLVSSVVAAGALGCSSSEAGLYRADLGYGPGASLTIEIIEDVLQSYGYETRAQGARLETDWNVRSAQGAEQRDAARVRDRLRANLSRRVPNQNIHAVQMTAEYEALPNRDGSWQPRKPSEAAVQRYEKIEKDIRERLGDYVRQ